MSLYPRALRSLATTTFRSRQLRHAHAAVRDDESEAARVHRDNATRASRFRQPLPDDTMYPGPASASTFEATSRPPEPDVKGKGKARDPSVENYRFPTKGANGGPPSPFEILGLSRNASSADIKSQYYRLALLLHPDSSHPSSSPENFATLNRAYKLLSTPASREDYLQSNFGWSHDGRSNPYEFDPMMAEILRRKRDGAGRRFRSEGGRGAWGTYGPDGKWQPAQEYRAGAGEPKYMSHSSFGSMLIFLVSGSGSRRRAISLALCCFTLCRGSSNSEDGLVEDHGGWTSALDQDPAHTQAIVVGWIQYHRISMISETRREYLDSQHMDASHALQQAREDRQKYGPMRMEAIQRRVNEMAALRELAKQEAEAEANAAAMRRIAPPPLPRPIE